MGGDRYDAIVVGAGPAGAAAALTMAQNNLSVLLLERGKFPGSKNMFGGTIYAKPTSEIIPAFWEKAPLERKVVSEEMWFLDTDSAVKVGFTGLRYAQAPYSKFTAYRPKFDRWLADQAVKSGAVLRCEALAQDLLWDKTGLFKKQVNGVQLDTGENIYADVVILAEGVLSMLAQKAGLRKPLMAHHFTLYVQKIFGLPSEKIESRFNLEKGEGATLGMLGHAAAGSVGKGGIWTNIDTVSVSTGTYLSEMMTRGLSPLHILDRFIAHPLVKRYLEGAELLEYKAHLIPKGGYEKIPTLYNDGIMVCGDAAMMISGRRGSDLAMLTGKAAGETASEAHAKGDFTSEILRGYENKVNQSFYFQDIRSGRKSNIYWEHHPDSDFLLNKLLNQIAYKFFDVELKAQEEIIADLKEEILKIQPLDKTLKDVYHGLFNWGVL